MKVKLIVIDLEVPARLKRVALCLGVPLVVLGAAGIAWSQVPKTWTDGDTLTAADLNENFTDLDTRVTAAEQAIPVITAWQSYTPVLSGNTGIAVATATSTGRYRRVGDSVEVLVHTDFSGPPASGAAWWQWSLPAGMTVDYAKLPVAGAGSSVGSGLTVQGFANNVALTVYARGPATVSATANGASTYYVNDTVPFAWGDGGEMHLVFTVPITGWKTTQ